MERSRPNRCRNGLPRVGALLGALLGLVLLLLTTPLPVGAHAFLRESDPAANAVLPTAPAEMTLRFTEPLEQSYSRADLHDQTGAQLDGASFRFGPDGFTLVVSLPAGLVNGTYSVLWRTLSTADGHTAQGYVPFTVGTDRDVTTVVPPATEQISAGAWRLHRSPRRRQSGTQVGQQRSLAGVIADPRRTPPNSPVAAEMDAQHPDCPIELATAA